jgi:hypothetical protein
MAGPSPVVLATGGAAAPAALALVFGVATVVVAGVPAAPLATPVVVLGNAALPAADIDVLTGGQVGGNEVELVLLVGVVGEPQPRFEASAWKAKKVATRGENFIDRYARVEMVVEANYYEAAAVRAMSNVQCASRLKALQHAWGKMRSSQKCIQMMRSSNVMPCRRQRPFSGTSACLATVRRGLCS